MTLLYADLLALHDAAVARSHSFKAFLKMFDDEIRIATADFEADSVTFVFDAGLIVEVRIHTFHTVLLGEPGLEHSQIYTFEAAWEKLKEMQDD